MQKLICTCCVLLFTSLSVFSQSGYFYLEKEGTTYNFQPNNANTIMEADKDDELTDIQSIPFEFDFFGKKVTHYRVSDNGYITFDTASTNSASQVVDLNDSKAPENSIYAFWNDFNLRNRPNSRNPDDKITNFTYTNNAGNDVHVIQWIPISKNGNGIYVIAVRLYENGTIDVVHNLAGFGQGNDAPQGAIGMKNKDGTKVTQVNNSPNISMADLAAESEDDKVYYFRSGSQPQYDVAISDIDVSGQYVRDKTVLAGKSVDIKAELFNYGSEAVNSLEINYKLNNGSTKTKQINNVNIAASGGKNTFSFTPSNLSANQSYDIQWWIGKINGNDDEFSGNDQKLNRTYFINNGNTTNKKPLIEEFSTAQCGWCPDGKVILESIKSNIPDVNIAQHHAAFGTDKMTIPEHQSYASGMGISGAPIAMIDRTRFFGNSGIGVSRGEWAQKASDRLNFPSPIKLNIDYNKLEEQKYDITIEAEFIDQVPDGDLRITAFLVQNKVVGEGQGWDQTNYLDQFRDHPYAGEGDPIEGYEHKDVVRDVITETWGDGGVIPNSPKANETYKAEITYDHSNEDIPNLYSQDGHKILAFVHYHESNRNDRIILNSKTKSINNLTASDGENIEKSFGFDQVFPNPAENITNAEFNLDKKSQVSLDIYSPVGKHVKSVVNDRKYIAGDQRITINTRDLNPGIYIARLQVNDQTIAKEFMVK